MHHISADMKQCIDECLDCYSICLSTAMGHLGGEHTKPPHFKLMMACAEICRTSAHSMLIGSEHHKHVCRECAEICMECAQDCERIGDAGMRGCLPELRRKLPQDERLTFPSAS